MKKRIIFSNRWIGILPLQQWAALQHASGQPVQQQKIYSFLGYCFNTIIHKDTVLGTVPDSGEVHSCEDLGDDPLHQAPILHQVLMHRVHTKHQTMCHTELWKWSSIISPSYGSLLGSWFILSIFSNLVSTPQKLVCSHQKKLPGCLLIIDLHGSAVADQCDV